VLYNKDFVFKDIGGVEGIHSIENTNRIYGIYMLLYRGEFVVRKE
jgi:hypothetical protein